MPIIPTPAATRQQYTPLLAQSSIEVRGILYFEWEKPQPAREDERADDLRGGNSLPYLYVAAFDRYLWEIIGTDKVAGTWFDHVIKENLADRIVAVSRFTVVENGEESGVKLVIEDRITRLPDRTAEACSIPDDLQAADVYLYVVLRVK